MFWAGCLGIFLALAGGSSCLRAQEPGASSCDQFLLVPRHVKGDKTVGPTSCRMHEVEITLEGRPYVRLDVGLDGTVEGYVAKAGNYYEYLTNSPDLVFPQAGNPGPLYFAIATYERDKGAAMTIVYPRDRSAWNGKMWVTVHGRGELFKLGNLKAWDKNFDPADPNHDLNKYDRLMISKGYVLVKTYRTTVENQGEIKATLEDGSVVDYVAFNDTARYIMDFTAVARKMIAERLGQPPRLTYLYGHSAGARIGHDINYTPGLNVDRNGKAFFNGLLDDDAAAGTWLPFVLKDGKDVLFATNAEKAAFVPQLDITHQMYNNINERLDKTTGYMSVSFLANKRHNALMLRDKGLKERMYEVRGISHSGAENFVDRTQNQNLDFARMMGRFIDILDAWVDKGTPPPPTHSDWAVLVGTNPDGTIKNPGLAFPEIACPLGVYYPSPTSTSGATAFAPFSGTGIEPLDRNKQFIDMNRNGVWDFVETPTQAWRRLGLLHLNESLTREKYVACVQKAAELLHKEGFFSEKTTALYDEEAKEADLHPKATTPARKESR